MKDSPDARNTKVVASTPNKIEITTRDEKRIGWIRSEYAKAWYYAELDRPYGATFDLPKVSDAFTGRAIKLFAVTEIESLSLLREHPKTKDIGFVCRISEAIYNSL